MNNRQTQPGTKLVQNTLTSEMTLYNFSATITAYKTRCEGEISTLCPDLETLPDWFFKITPSWFKAKHGFSTIKGTRCFFFFSCLYQEDARSSFHWSLSVTSESCSRDLFCVAKKAKDKFFYFSCACNQTEAMYFHFSITLTKIKICAFIVYLCSRY
jgi:hypothetical protein